MNKNPAPALSGFYQAAEAFAVFFLHQEIKDAFFSLTCLRAVGYLNEVGAVNFGLLHGRSNLFLPIRNWRD